MRPVLPPRLKKRRARKKGRPNYWVIKDQEQEISTGLREDQRPEAEIRLAEYTLQTRRPAFGKGDPNTVIIGDALTAYVEGRGTKSARPDGLAVEIERLAEFWGAMTVSEITEELSDEYVRWRTDQTDARAKKRPGRKIAVSTAKRELVTLSAALNHSYPNKKIDRPTVVHLPKVAERRERYLSRSEYAALLAGALGFDRNGKRHHARINRHAARFIMIAFRTGTRHDTILNLQFRPNTTGGWFDLDAGILYRRPQDAIETNKRRTPCPIPKKLIPHLHRWRRLSTQFVVEHEGKPIASQLRRSWRGARELAGLGPEVTPHVLRHSLATLLLQDKVSIFDVAGLLGTSPGMIARTYGHHAVEHLREAIDGLDVSGVKTGSAKTRRS
jgi:integrase